MRLGVLAIGLVLGTLLPRTVSAERTLTTRGYVLSRSQVFPRDKTGDLYPELDVAPFQSFIETNLDLTWSGDTFTARADTSALFSCNQESNLPGCLVINELYLSRDVVEDLAVLVGRARSSWGAALSFHPVEPMNQQPDPTDPTFQRLGAWTVATELSGENFVATAAWFPDVSHFEVGIPKAVEPGMLGARFAWRPEGFDLSALGFVDLVTGRPQVGASGSAVLGSTSFEVHGEALVHERRPLDAGALEEGTCPIRNLGFPHRRKWDYTGIIGTRWESSKGSLLNLEYLHQADGLTDSDYEGSLDSKDLLLVQCPNMRIEGSDTSEKGRPQQLSSTLLRRNYAIFSAAKPTFGDLGRLANLGAALTVFVGLDDRSGVVSGRITYAFRESVIIRLGGLYRYGTGRSQYAILPFHGLFSLDIQVLL